MFTIKTDRMNSTDQPLTITDEPATITVWEQRNGKDVLTAHIVIEPGTIDIYGPDDHYLGTWYRAKIDVSPVA